MVNRCEFEVCPSNCTDQWSVVCDQNFYEMNSNMNSCLAPINQKIICVKKSTSHSSNMLLGEDGAAVGAICSSKTGWLTSSFTVAEKQRDILMQSRCGEREFIQENKNDRCVIYRAIKTLTVKHCTLEKNPVRKQSTI